MSTRALCCPLFCRYRKKSRILALVLTFSALVYNIHLSIYHDPSHNSSRLPEGKTNLELSFTESGRRKPQGNVQSVSQVQLKT